MTISTISGILILLANINYFPQNSQFIESFNFQYIQCSIEYSEEDDILYCCLNMTIDYTFKILINNEFEERKYFVSQEIDIELDNNDSVNYLFDYKDMTNLTVDLYNFDIESSPTSYTLYFDFNIELEVEYIENNFIYYTASFENFGIYMYKQGANIQNEINEFYSHDLSISNTISYLIKEEIFNEGYLQGYLDGLKNSNLDEYNRGYREGFTQGDINGYNRGFEDGYTIASEEVFDEGYKQGYEQGEVDGVNSKYKPIDVIKRCIDIVVRIFSLEIFPGINLAVCFGIPLILAIVAFVLRWFR